MCECSRQICRRLLEGSDGNPSRTNAGSRPPRIASWYFKPAHAKDDRIAFTNTTIRARGMGPHHGILIIQLRQPNRRRIHRRIMQALERFADTEWPGLLIVMHDAAQSSWQGQDRR